MLSALLAQAVQRTALKRREVNLYLLKLYMDAAGMLPQKQLGVQQELSEQCARWFHHVSWIIDIGWIDKG